MVAHGTADQVHFCEVEWRRQRTFHGFERNPVLDNSKLTVATPVVQLRPFTRKEWSRDSSLAGALDAQLSGQCMGIPDNQKVPPQNLPINLPNPTRQAHVVDLTDQIIPKVHRFQPRTSPRLHKATRLQNSFTTLEERTRTMHKEKCTTILSLYSQKENVERAEKMNGVCLSGAKMANEITRRRLEYLNPLMKYDKCENGKVFVDSKCTSYLGSGHCSILELMDDSDLSCVLPSVRLSHRPKINLTQGRREKVKAEKNKSVCPRINGIKSSFQILIENGPPANIERHLIVELEKNLENVRRHRDRMLHSSTKHKTFQQITYRGQPTAGEKQLERGLSMNSRRSQKESQSKTKVCYNSNEAKADCGDSGIQSPVETGDALVGVGEKNDFRDHIGQLVQSLKA